MGIFSVVAFYWSIHSVPELGELPKATRKELWKKYGKKTPYPWWRWLFPYANAFVELANSWARPRHLYAVTVADLILLFAFGLVGEHLHIAAALPKIRTHLGGLCPQCGYDVRATPDKCPECGASLKTASPAQVLGPRCGPSPHCTLRKT